MRFLFLMALLGGCEDKVIVDYFGGDFSVPEDLGVPEDLSVDLSGPYGPAYWTARQAACAAAGGVCLPNPGTYLQCGPPGEIYFFDLGPSPLLGSSTCEYRGGPPSTPGSVLFCCRPYTWPCEAAGGICHLQSECAPGDSLDAGACPDVTANTPAPCCAH